MTIKELAKKCNVSPSTISNILNGRSNVSEETRNQILKVIKDTGYRPNYFASSMRKKETDIIGVVTEDLGQFTTVSIVESLTAACEKKGYRTILMNMRTYDRWQDTWYDDTKIVEDVLYKILSELESIRVRGIVYVAGHDREIRYFPKNYSIPTVIAYATSLDSRFPSILPDDEKGGYDMTAYLLSMGHRKIGVISGVRDNRHTMSRLNGYQRALFDAGVLYDPNLIVEGNWKCESGYDEAPKLLKKGVTVIWAMNDEMAAGAYRYLNEMKIQVGQEISVAGFDNRFGNQFLFPPLTTNALPLSEIGEKSAVEIIRILSNEESEAEKTKKCLIPCKMIIRESVADLNGVKK